MWSIAGDLTVYQLDERPELLAAPVAAALDAGTRARCGVVEIDPELADTAQFCAQYGSPLDASANCVVVAGKRAGEEKLAACMVLATTRADINNAVRKRLDVRKASFAPMDRAVELTGMAYGGITPFGLPTGWPVLIDAAVANSAQLVVGAGLRGAKLLVPGDVLAALPGAEVVEGLGR